jgi:transcriptional regulator GlxA family with amidase domain
MVADLYRGKMAEDGKMAGLRVRPPLSVGFILADNFTLSAFSLFVDFLRLAADDGDRSRRILCRWTIMSGRQATARASCGVQISRDSGFLDPKNFDYIVVVGGLLHAGPQMDDETNAYLAAAARDGVTLIGLCTGSFILCRAGLMRGRRVCVSWYHYQDFLAEFPDHRVIADRMFFVDGNRITCSGGAGTADLASFLIERHLSRAVAQKARHVLLLDPASAGAAVPERDGRAPGPALPAAAAALCALAAGPYRSLDHRDRARFRICRLRPLLAQVQGAAWVHADRCAGAGASHCGG